MRRGVLVLLLVSLGINLGLGYRLLVERRASVEGSAEGAAPAQRSGTVVRPGQTGGPGGPGGVGGPGRQGGLGPALQDSAVWSRQVDHRLERLQAQLDLPPERAEEFARLHRQHAARLWELGRELRERRLAVRAVLESSQRDRHRVRRAVMELNGVQARLDSAVAEAMLAELEALPPDGQIRYLEALPWQRWGPGRHGGRQGPRHGRPDAGWGGSQP
ncbi:MAG: periplasmic heavy metal sensor [Candidatus Krumholzibacteriia bacterium]